jgi:hypothetical protein
MEGVETPSVVGAISNEMKRKSEEAEPKKQQQDHNVNTMKRPLKIATVRAVEFCIQNSFHYVLYNSF